MAWGCFGYFDMNRGRTV